MLMEFEAAEQKLMRQPEIKWATAVPGHAGQNPR